MVTMVVARLLHCGLRVLRVASWNALEDVGWRFLSETPIQRVGHGSFLCAVEYSQLAHGLVV